MQRDAELGPYLYAVSILHIDSFRANFVAFQGDLIRVEKKKCLPSSEETELQFCDVQQQELELGRGRIDLNRRRWRKKRE